MCDATVSRDDSAHSHRAVHVAFGLRSRYLDPQSVSSALGVEPTRSFAKGDSFTTKSGRHERPWGLWRLSSQANIASLDIEDHILYILRKLEPRKEQLRSYLDDEQVDCRIRIWWEQPGTSGSLDVPSDLVMRLAALCNNVTLTFLGTEDEED